VAENRGAAGVGMTPSTTTEFAARGVVPILRSLGQGKHRRDACIAAFEYCTPLEPSLAGKKRRQGAPSKQATGFCRADARNRLLGQFQGVAENSE